MKIKNLETKSIGNNWLKINVIGRQFNQGKIEKIEATEISMIAKIKDKRFYWIFPG
jgi:hypothetical protein